MEWKCMLCSIVAFFIASFSVNISIVTAAATIENDSDENSKILCERACFKPIWQAKFDKEKSVCICTLGGDIDEAELREIKQKWDRAGLKIMFLKRHILPKRDTDAISKNNDIPKPALKTKTNENQLKSKKKKKVDASEQSKKEKAVSKETPADSVIEKTSDDSTTNPKIQAKHEDNIEKIPKTTSQEKNVISEHAIEEKTNFKRVAKEPPVESEEATPKRPHGKLLEPLKIPKRPKLVAKMGEDDLPQNKLGKPLITPKKLNALCAPGPIRHQLEVAKERISKLIERTHQANFNCQINAEIESIKSLLQQASSKNQEVRHKDFDRTKIMQQIKEREKERQARIQSRFSHLELPKSKYNIVGGLRATDKTPSIDDKGKSHGIIVEPENLIDA